MESSHIHNTARKIDLFWVPMLSSNCHVSAKSDIGDRKVPEEAFVRVVSLSETTHTNTQTGQFDVSYATAGTIGQTP